MRYFTIAFTEQWPNGKFNVDAVAYQDPSFPTMKKCTELVLGSTGRKPIRILSVTEYAEDDYKTLLSEY